MLTLAIDESGKGPVIGSLFIAGAVFEESDLPKLKQLGVKDSKLILHKKRIELAKEIKKIAKKFKVIQIPPSEIDEAIDGDNKLNLNWLEANKIAEIINSLKHDRVIIDCPSPNISAYTNYVRELLKNKNDKLIVEHKADAKFLECASSSILAKVEREKEVSKLKEKYGNIGSLPYNEEIVIEQEGNTSLEKIGKIIENKPKNINVYSFNPNTFNINKFNVTGLFTHKKNNIYRIHFDKGKKIKLTPNHPIFVLTENLEVIPKKIYNLDRGDYVAFSGNLIAGDNSKINLMDYLVSYSNFSHPIYIYGKEIKLLINKYNKKIQDLIKKFGYNRTVIYLWLKSNSLPLHLAKEFNKSLKYSNLKLKAREGVSLPVEFSLDEDFMYFLGIFISEGSFSNHKVIISNTDNKIIKKTLKFIKKFKINYHFSKGDICVHSVLLNKLLKSFNVGSSAKNKKIPKFIFMCPKDLIKAFLNGVYDGDAYFKDNTLEIELRSKEVIEDLQTLELLLGNFTSIRERKNRNSFISRILSKSTNSLSIDNVPAVIGNYIKKLRLKRKISLRQMEKKINIPRRTLSFIERNICDTIQKNTLKKINTLFNDPKINKLINSDFVWLKILSAKSMNRKELVYDLEVKPNGYNIENFIGKNGIILHNSGYPSDPTTKEFLQKNYKKYPEIFRKSWAPYKKLNLAKKQSKLSDF